MSTPTRPTRAPTLIDNDHWPDDERDDLDLDWQAYMMTAEDDVVEGPRLLGIMDSACSRTCHGSEWGDMYRSFLTDKGLVWEELRADVHVRGIGGQCTRAYKWPVGLYRRPGEILSLEIPGSSTPLLLSRQTQKTLGAVLDFANQLVDLTSLGSESTGRNQGRLQVDTLLWTSRPSHQEATQGCDVEVKNLQG